ncbi:MAG: adenylyl-sulfate kinase [Deltaproteobacteria bacterium]|nr:adenylyl-sulfate kinase [Deltaproteobacteria bacterium]
MKLCLWITGLPGSGKSTIAKKVREFLTNAAFETIILNLDEIRKSVTPEPDYSDRERDIVYAALTYMAMLLVTENCRSVIIDATGNRRIYRERARMLIPEFAEVYIRCPLDICREREASRDAGYVQTGLYTKADSGLLKAGLPGITVPYEESEHPDIIIDSNELTPSESADKILKYVRYRWSPNSIHYSQA